VPKASRGWDNAKKVNGRKRHIAVDTTGLLLTILVTAATVRDNSDSGWVRSSASSVVRAP
jgi:Transposase DDE domain